MLRHMLCRWNLGVLLLVATLSGCSVFIPSTVRFEEFRSQPQELVVLNQLSETVILVPAQNGQPEKELAPGGLARLRFEVITISELERADDAPWYRRRADSRLTELRSLNDSSYLRQKGEAALSEAFHPETT